MGNGNHGRRRACNGEEGEAGIGMDWRVGRQFEDIIAHMF